MNRFLRSKIHPALALAVLVLAGGALRAQSTSPNPGTAGPTGRESNPYWGTSPSGYGERGAPGGQGTGMGYSIRSPSPLSGNFLDTGLMGMAGSSFSPRPGQYSFRRSFPSSMLGYYSPAALAEAASLFARNSQQERDNTAHITLQVPAGAEVWFDGKETKQTGSIRHFSSPALQPGKNYFYTIRVRWQKDGKPVEETRRLNVRANDQISLDLVRSSNVAKSTSSEAAR